MLFFNQIFIVPLLPMFFNYNIHAISDLTMLFFKQIFIIPPLTMFFNYNIHAISDFSHVILQANLHRSSLTYVYGKIPLRTRGTNKYRET